MKNYGPDKRRMMNQALKERLASQLEQRAGKVSLSRTKTYLRRQNSIGLIESFKRILVTDVKDESAHLR
jgi:hypothetical protein